MEKEKIFKENLIKYLEEESEFYSMKGDYNRAHILRKLLRKIKSGYFG